MSRHPAQRAKLQALLPADTDLFRLIDGQDLTVDLFGDVAVLSLYRNRTEPEEAALAAELAGTLKLRAVYLKRRPKDAHGKARDEWVAPPTPLAGAPVEAVEAREAGAKYEIRPANGLSVGLYVDARDVRAWVRANAAGRTTLNLFSYTCGFSIAARLGGATRAVNVDLSRKVLDWGERNHTLNGLSVDRRDFIAGDCFDWLARFAKKSEKFGLVILDPPSFSNADGKRFRVETDYPQLVSAAVGVLADDGLLVCCCNLETIGSARFEQQVAVGVSGTQLAKVTAFGASAIDLAQPSALKVVVVSRPGGKIAN